MTNVLTMKEVAKMMKVLKMMYPYFYKDLDENHLDEVIKIWIMELKNHPKEVVVQGFYNMLRTCKTAPTLGHLIEQIEFIEDAGTNSNFVLERQLKKAITDANKYFSMFNNTGVGLGETRSQAEEAREKLKLLFNGLNPIIKEYVVDVNGLLELADNDWRYERTRFLDAIPYLKTRQRILKQKEEKIKQIANTNQSK